ncbi:NRAMP family divalent metal transporter [Actinomadura rudentiformis]|uniref:Divalent metal cation transporter n=1 Tax=Actinomadura rudentiformis TaxID=359158 RepID=A0A6H9YP78_9ACTN|nr:NRAMP family divalent metal transporter [Actinomadura rudentiformis]KAB2349503.1 divalent metal cation transporter [Actinomadura rudentiformis]
MTDGITKEQVKPPSAAPRAALIGAMFLMATSAIGPGFITQTTVFTAKLGAAMAFAILVSVLVDIAIQMNVWRVVGVSGRRAQDLGNSVLPGAGYLLAALDVFGGIVFNIGNVAGCALGLNALLGLDVKIGGTVSAAFAIAIFLIRRAGVAMDRIVIGLGIVMILMTLYVAIVSGPPLGDALTQTVLPEEVDFLVITTLIGGTVGGYIVYAGAHRMIESGVRGEENVKEITRSSINGILITAMMRVLLFLAVLGVVAGGVKLAAANPAPSAFEHAGGEAGLRVFGLIMWSAAITSVIGASYTSVSFLVSFSSWIERNRNWLVVAFIVVSTAIYLAIGKTPVTLLILAGALNGLILPVGLGLILWVAARRRDLLGGYRYPNWLLSLGVLAWGVSLFVGWKALTGIADLWN